MLVIGAREVGVDGVESSNYLRNPKFALHPRDMRVRSAFVQQVCLHTRLGIRQQPLEQVGRDRRWDELVAGRWSRDDRYASAHIAIDADGSFVCMADLERHVTLHAGQVNERSVGIEIYQEPDGTVYLPSLESAVKILDVITRTLGIQRQFAVESTICRRLADGVRRMRGGKPNLAYVKGGLSGADFVGIFGHRNVTRNRGPGDPGEHVFNLLRTAGYEHFLVDADEDLDTWTARQEGLGLHEDLCTGVAGSETVVALSAAGRRHGMYVQRPGD